MATTALHFLVLTAAGWSTRRQQRVIAYLRTENRVLREQLPKRIAFTDPQRRRLALSAKSLGRAVLRELETIVTPDTLLAWYRRLVASKYDGSSRRRPGRPRVRGEIRTLVLRLARENPRWGYTRIVGVVKLLGYSVARSTVARILAENGMEPAPVRSERLSWGTFLRAHWSAIAAADFFTVEVLTLFGLARYHVFFVIELATRRVHVAGVKADPHGRWMLQIGRGLVDGFDGFLREKRLLIVDRDPLYTKAFRELLGSAGVEVVRLPARSPNLNAYAERFVRSIRQECLNHVIPLGERHLGRVLREYVEHYNFERPHQGIGNELIHPRDGPVNDNGPVSRKVVWAGCSIPMKGRWRRSF